MLLKCLAIVGLAMTALGTILLWRSSPAGYAPSVWMDAETHKKMVDNNKRMARGQTAAIALIVLGSAMQVPSMIYG